MKHAKYEVRTPWSADDFLSLCRRAGYVGLPIDSHHVRGLDHGDARGSALVHADPFDRIIIAQALTEQMDLLTADKKMLSYGLTFLVNARQRAFPVQWGTCSYGSGASGQRRRPCAPTCGEGRRPRGMSTPGSVDS